MRMALVLLAIASTGAATPPTYTGEIAKILNKKCVLCHRKNQAAPFHLTTYSQASAWAPMIAEVVSQDRMPPWDANPAYGEFSNDRRLRQHEKQLLLEWAKSGARRGVGDSPDAPNYPDGWTLPQTPDAVYWMRDEPFVIPALGVLDYQYYTVDPGFTEDKWITAIELVPSNPKAVHHAGIYMQLPDEESRVLSFSRVLAGYVPGRTAQLSSFPKGAAIKVPAGSRLVFQLHYTPIGRVTSDRTKCGIVFAKDDPITHEIIADSVIGNGFAIPPGCSNYQFVARKKLAEACTLRALNPHMHYRGRSFTYEAIYPNGDREILLDVPQYDFNWQSAYIFASPKLLPPGTVLECTAVFDNSASNPLNPDPSATVRWGELSTDEMMNGTYQVIVAK